MDLIHSIINIPDKLIYSIDSNTIEYKYIDRTIKINYTINNNGFVTLSISKDHDKSDKLLEEHILRTINNVFKQNVFNMDSFYDIAQFIVTIVVNPYVYCTICGKKYNYVDEKIGSCEESGICFDNFCENVTDNIITDYIKRDKLVLLLLVKTAIECIKSERVEKVFNPRPSFCKSITEIQKLKKYITDNELYTKIKELKLDSIIDDTIVHEKLGRKMYGLVKYIIITNKTHIIAEKIENVKQQDIFKINELDIDNKTCNLQDFLNFSIVSYNESEVFNNTDNGGKPFYVYHGSNIACWYSIMRNGLKNYSETDMMVNGAALGNGIYFATDPRTAFGYSYRHVGGKEGDKEDIIILGVAQLINEEKYSKGNGVYVVPNEKDVILRYLIVLTQLNLNKVKDFFSKRATEIGSGKKYKYDILTKRLMSEHKHVMKFIDKQNKNNSNNNYTLDLKNSNPHNWLVKLNNYIFEFNFDRESYPLIPFEIRLIDNKFKNQNVYLDKISTSDGTIRIKELQINNWNVTTTVTHILKKLNDIII